MFNVWFDVGFGIVVVFVALWLVYKMKKDLKSSDEDDNIIKIIEKELELDGMENFELKSIVTLNNSNITSIIVYSKHQEVAMEVNNITGEIVHKERLARQ